MASILGHAVVALALSTALPKDLKNKGIVMAGVIASMIPDADVLAFSFGIPYEAAMGHRGFTHSIVFAFLMGYFLVYIFRKPLKILPLYCYFFCCTLSHGLLDACTTGGRGVGFLIPFNNDRFFFPWQVIKVSPIGAARFFSNWGLEVLKNELMWIGLPCLAFSLLMLSVKHEKD